MSFSLPILILIGLSAAVTEFKIPRLSNYKCFLEISSPVVMLLLEMRNTEYVLRSVT